MAEQHSNPKQEVEAMNYSGSGNREQHPPQEVAAPEQEAAEGRVIPVDLYHLPTGDALVRLPDGSAVLLPPGTNGNCLDRLAVESTVGDATDAAGTYPLSPEEEAVVQQEAADQEESEMPMRHRSRKRFIFLVPLFILLFLAAGIASYVYLLPLAATATVIITPKTQTLHLTTTLAITRHPKGNQVQGRELKPISVTVTQTVHATGHGHQDAIRATGVMTFYNADSSPFTVAAGVSFTLSTGITVVTTQSVTIQAAVPPQFGTAIAPAYVVQAGSIGNIAAHSINTRCCGSVFVTATNTTPFSGGEDERDYAFIQQSDIHRAATNQLTHLTPTVIASLQKQGRQGEQLVTPVCTPHTISSANAGTEAASVSVSVTQTCRSVAYSHDSLELTATTLLAHTAHLATYQQAESVQVTVNGSIFTKQTAKLHVSLSGVWMYSFSQAQLISLSHLIAGVPQTQARGLLERQAGVAQVTLTLRRFDFKDLLPTDFAHIQVVSFGVSQEQA